LEWKVTQNYCVHFHQNSTNTNTFDNRETLTVAVTRKKIGPMKRVAIMQIKFSNFAIQTEAPGKYYW